MNLRVLIGVGAIAAALASGCSAPSQQGKWITDYEPLDDAYGYVVEFEQGWTDDTQQAFYNTAQGSEIMPYEWILALEQSDSQTRFLDSANITRYRYLPRKASQNNPDGLPVGWTKGGDSAGKHWFGLSCAACHTTELQYSLPDGGQTIAMRIDGAPTLADFELMNVELVEALQATLNEPAKFSRFAKAILPAGASGNAQQALRGELELIASKLETRNRINASEVHYGFGRIDAIGFIINQTMSTLPGMPQNAKPSDAPASYPFLWGTDQSDVVQWTGFAANLSGAGVLVRNGGEVIGVYGKVVLGEGDTYESSILIENLGKLENWVRELNSPAWPGDLLPPIDEQKAAAGAALYAEACAQCHQVIPRSKAIKTAYKAVITPISELKTDPTELDNLSTRTYTAGVYAGKKSAVLAGDVITDPTTGLNPLVNAVTGSLLKHAENSAHAFIKEHATRTAKPSDSEPGYKGRPLNGIWATAPYLHNGAVPNLYELLLPAAQRSRSFVLGSRRFDPVRVGFAMDQPTTAKDYTPFVFDVSLKGNSNAGHEYLGRKDGTPFTEAERWMLVEYMKTL